MTWRLRIKIIILASLFSGLGTHALGLSLDRLVLQVEGTAYTQRHFELYTAAKGVLLGQSPSDWLVGPDTYAPRLDEYLRDMLVDYEAERLGGYGAEAAAVAKALVVMQQALKESPELQALAQRLVADQTVDRVIINLVLRVQNLVLSRQRQSSSSSRNKGSQIVAAILNPKSDWFVKLDQRTSFRIFEGARAYRPIAPYGLK